MKKLLYVLIVLTFVNIDLFAQGCVAIRSTGASCSIVHPDSAVSKGWQLSTSYRYFKSFRHFKGRTEQHERLEQKTEVINWSHSLDITLHRQLNNRWGVSVGVPLLYNDRSSLYEHGRTERHTSSSQGIGDMRFMVSRWMLDPHKFMKFNFQLGLGVKLPTGNYKYEDEFQNVGPEGRPENRPVDQSIQLGDGGVGAIIDLNGYYSITKDLSAYANFFYLINPRNQNGTRTYLETLSPKYNDDRYYMSVPDQYMLRGGLNYSLNSIIKGISFGTGFRMEGLPAEDLIGKSEGWRRPGYVVSIEPGINYTNKSVSLFAFVPVALQRNRIQSMQDKKESKATGTKVVGDAAFADYSINVGAAFKF